VDTSHQQTRRLPIHLDLPEGRIEAEIELPHATMRLVDLAAIALDLSSTVADIGARITRQARPPDLLWQRVWRVLPAAGSAFAT